MACRWPPRLRRCRPVVIPDEAGMGHAPQSFAKAASERIRSGLSPNRINISAAVWAPTPKLAARRPSPMIDLYRKKAFSTRAC